MSRPCDFGMCNADECTDSNCLNDPSGISMAEKEAISRGAEQYAKEHSPSTQGKEKK